MFIFLCTSLSNVNVVVKKYFEWIYFSYYHHVKNKDVIYSNWLL